MSVSVIVNSSGVPFWTVSHWTFYEVSAPVAQTTSFSFAPPYTSVVSMDLILNDVQTMKTAEGPWVTKRWPFEVQQALSITTNTVHWPPLTVPPSLAVMLAFAPKTRPAWLPNPPPIRTTRTKPDGSFESVTVLPAGATIHSTASASSSAALVSTTTVFSTPSRSNSIKSHSMTPSQHPASLSPAARPEKSVSVSSDIIEIVVPVGAVCIAIALALLWWVLHQHGKQRRQQQAWLSEKEERARCYAIAGQYAGDSPRASLYRTHEMAERGDFQHLDGKEIVPDLVELPGDSEWPSSVTDFSDDETREGG